MPYFKKYRQRLFWGILALLTVDLLQLYIPRVIKQAVDALQLGQATSASLLRQGGLIICFAIGIALFRFTWRYLVLGFSRLLERDLRSRLLSRLVRLDRPFFNRRSAGEIMALSGNDLTNVQLACGMGIVSFIDAFMMTGAKSTVSGFQDVMSGVAACISHTFLLVSTCQLGRPQSLSDTPT